MKLNLFKKVLSLLLVTSILSFTMANSVSALGGGPSPSAAWTYNSSTVKRFTTSQLQSLHNQAWEAHEAGRTSKAAYNFSLVILGFAGFKGTTASSYISFLNTQFDLNQTTLNTLGRALASGNSSVAVEMKTWIRPASGEKMSAFTKLP